nr:MAG TPA: hypothetical protein [Caudoviricetes sp.]
MTNEEYKEREERMYSVVQAISGKTLNVLKNGRSIINVAYDDCSEVFRYQKHLFNVGYGFSDLTDLVEELGKVLFELEIEYKQNHKP